MLRNKGQKNNNRKGSLHCYRCGFNINGFGGCDGCECALDTDELTREVAREVTSPDSDDGIGFAASVIDDSFYLISPL